MRTKWIVVIVVICFSRQILRTSGFKYTSHESLRQKDYGKGRICSRDDQCPHQSYCNNLEGTCKCKSDLIGDGRTCKLAPTAECESDTDCYESASCIDKKCVCKGKTVGGGREDCRELQPCPRGKNYCGFSKVCLVDPLFPDLCSALSECERRGDFCPRGASCEKKNDGSYKCVCKSGLKMAERPRGQNRKCEDIDECRNKQSCPEDKLCENTEGAYKCTCKNGFKDDENGICIADCNCGAHGECLTGHECTCHVGYFDDGGVCRDVDECRTTCMKDTQQCINSQGSYNCKCKAGYEKKNGAADDECTKVCKCRKHEKCDKNGNCKCKKGYIKKHGKCVRVKALSKIKGDAYSTKSSGHLTLLTSVLLGGLALTA